jgi:hypothetical protein
MLLKTQDFSPVGLPVEVWRILRDVSIERWNKYKAKLKLEREEKFQLLDIKWQ